MENINLNPEFLGSILDVFDDFLEDHNIRIPESDRELKSDFEYDPNNFTDL